METKSYYLLTVLFASSSTQFSWPIDRDRARLFPQVAACSEMKPAASERDIAVLSWHAGTTDSLHVQLSSSQIDLSPLIHLGMSVMPTAADRCSLGPNRRNAIRAGLDRPGSNNGDCDAASGLHYWCLPAIGSQPTFHHQCFGSVLKASLHQASTNHLMINLIFLISKLL